MKNVPNVQEVMYSVLELVSLVKLLVVKLAIIRATATPVRIPLQAYPMGNAYVPDTMKDLTLMESVKTVMFLAVLHV